jgi:hypothetical protein
MIVSENQRPNQLEFEKLVSSATLLLNREAQVRPDYFPKRHGVALETDVFDAMVASSIRTKFEGSLELLSGHSFPDILAMKLFGAEVKSTSQNHWITAGNSIKETTRIDGIERIYLIFGKLVNPVEFKSRKYEECLREVVVTHSPRYRIDMDLPKGATIFDQIGMSYDELRSTSDPIGEIVKFYRGKLQEGESLWWAGGMKPVVDGPQLQNQQEVEVTSPFTLRPQLLVAREEKNQLLVKGLTSFTEVFGSNNPQKYSRYSLWLASTHSIIPTSIRDWFSAGGLTNLTVGKTEFKNVPQVFSKVYEFRREIFNELANDPDGDVRLFLGSNAETAAERVKQWAQSVIGYGARAFPSVHEFIQGLAGPMLEEIARRSPK